ncbi:MAG: TIGR04283 family arsenosugar biosynthesis glycosyltransferase [Burkholderiaceae bacterium]
MHISVVIPVLNERAHLQEAMDQLAPFVRQGGQALVVDGGSTDGTPALASQLGFTVIRSGPGRARQMNAGAHHATGDALLFLHIDTRLPDGWQQQIAASLQSAHAWGRFDVRISGRARMLKVVACMMNGRSRMTGIATGDQAMFMTRTAFNQVGGFPDQPLMEDIEISKRLLRLSRPACLHDKVTTSGRRWESRGVWTTIFLMWRLRFAYWRGHSASLLAKAYQ